MSADFLVKVELMCPACNGSGEVESEAHKAWAKNADVISKLSQQGIRMPAPPSEKEVCPDCNGLAMGTSTISLQELAVAIAPLFPDKMRALPSKKEHHRTDYFHTVKPRTPLGEFLRRKAVERKEINTETLAIKMGIASSTVSNIMGANGGPIGTRVIRGIRSYTTADDKALERMVVEHNLIANIKVTAKIKAKEAEKKGGKNKK